MRLVAGVVIFLERTSLVVILVIHGPFTICLVGPILGVVWITTIGVVIVVDDSVLDVLGVCVLVVVLVFVRGGTLVVVGAVV